MSDAPTRVLFVSTGGACRALFAEALLRHVGGARFDVASAGVEPIPVDPLALQVLRDAGIDVSGLRPDSVDEMRERSFDYVITLCDDARAVCPLFPGADQSMHWGYQSPAKIQGTDAERRIGYERVFREIGERIRQFVLIAGRPQPATAVG
jgi:protein-tyrosine-phosphatase